VPPRNSLDAIGSGAEFVQEFGHIVDDLHVEVLSVALTVEYPNAVKISNTDFTKVAGANSIPSRWRFSLD
jgi:hypothetical protein